MECAKIYSTETWGKDPDALDPSSKKEVVCAFVVRNVSLDRGKGIYSWVLI